MSLGVQVSRRFDVNQHLLTGERVKTVGDTPDSSAELPVDDVDAACGFVQTNTTSIPGGDCLA